MRLFQIFLKNSALQTTLNAFRDCHVHFFPGGGEGGKTAYERGGDARQKFWPKPLKETDLGMAQAFLDP